MMKLCVLAVALCSFANASIHTLLSDVTDLGDLCHGGTRYCLKEESECVNGKCVCNSHTEGNANLYCFDEGGYTCALTNDPIAVTTENQGVSLPLPCRYLLSHARTDIVRADKTGFCDMKVYAANERIAGKHFTYGFDLHVTAYYDDGIIDSFGFRVLGTASNDNYQYKVLRTQDSHQGFTLWTEDDSNLPGIVGSDTIIDIQNDARVHLYLDACGVRIYFRSPENEKGKNQERVPGLAVNFYHHEGVRFMSNHSTICLAPGRHLADVSQVLDVSEKEAFVHRALAQRVDQNFERLAIQECTALGNTIANCDSDNVKTALDLCAFIESSTHFNRCFNRESGISGSQNSLRILNNCYKAFCDRDSSLCTAFRDEVSNSPCSGHVPEIIRDHQCTFS